MSYPFRWMAALVVCMAGVAHAENYVELLASRIDYSLMPTSQFMADISVILDAPATGVNLTTPVGVFALEDDDGSGMDWGGEALFDTLDVLKGSFTGNWAIEVLGATPGTLSFALDASGLADGDFHATPTNLHPSHGSAVSPNVVTSWTAPPTITSDDLLIVDVENMMTGDEMEQQLLYTAESWIPGTLPVGDDYEFIVGYYRLAGEAMLSNVASSGLTWGNSPFAPVDATAGYPLLVLGAESLTRFAVVPEPAALALLPVALVMLRRRR